MEEPIAMDSTVTVKVGRDGSYGIEFWEYGKPIVESETGRYDVVANVRLKPHTVYCFRFEYKNEEPGYPELHVNRVPEGTVGIATTELPHGTYDWRVQEFHFTTGDVAETPTRMEWTLRRMDHFSSVNKGETLYRNISLTEE